MAKYHVSTLDLSTRIEIVAEMLLPQEKREWGRISKMAENVGLSRTRLYQLKEKAETVLQKVLAPEDPGRPKPNDKLVVDEAMIKRAIAVMPLIKGSTRDIQMGLEMLFGIHRSIGYINETLQEAGEKARQYNQQMVTDKQILAEVDEIFQGRKPCLTVVDGESFLLLNLSPAEARDETSWGVTLLELEAQGYDFADIVADGARGIAAGVAATEWGLPVQPDLFHLMQEAHPISKRLEKKAYQAIETADQTRLAIAEANCPIRRRGKPRHMPKPIQAAEMAEQEKIEQLDLWLWLLGEVRQALDPITHHQQLQSPHSARDTLETAIDLMAELKRADIDKFRLKLSKYLDALLAPLAQLNRRLAHLCANMSPEQEAEIIWACQYRQQFTVSWSELLSPALHPIAHQFERAFSLFHRASSLAESIHAWVRPYLHIHRGMPPWLAQLLQLWWNHHRFQRGKRAGHTPAELAGIPQPPSLTQLFANLFKDGFAMF